MENLTLEELKLLERAVLLLWWETSDGDQPEKDIIHVLGQKVRQAKDDKIFEEKTRPLNF